MGDITVQRWRRYGHDRLYVQDSGGERLGFWDSKSGTPHVEIEARRAEFEAALAEHGVTVPAQAPAPAVETVEAAEPVVGPPVVEQPWTDLATNRAAEGVRERASSERQAAPIRSLVARVLGVHTEERAWRLGADGEEAVAARLARLSESWRVLHSVPVGARGSDIDHVVIGPGGVYTVNAKHHPDATIWVGGNVFLVDGHKQPYIPKARMEAQRASRLLSGPLGFQLPVVGVVAVVGATGGFVVKSQPAGGDVFVVPRKQIDEWLTRRGPVLSPEQVESIFDVARRSTTWTG